jgi:hypothetical protein
MVGCNSTVVRRPFVMPKGSVAVRVAQSDSTTQPFDGETFETWNPIVRPKTHPADSSCRTETAIPATNENGPRPSNRGGCCAAASAIWMRLLNYHQGTGDPHFNRNPRNEQC